MLKKITGLILIALLGACEPVSKTGADGYKFGEAQYEKQTVQINVVTYKTKAEFYGALAKYGSTDRSIVAFSIIRAPFNTCTVHMMDPRVEYQPEFAGHEFLHCVYGQWHTDNDSRN